MDEMACTVGCYAPCLSPEELEKQMNDANTSPPPSTADENAAMHDHLAWDFGIPWWSQSSTLLPNNMYGYMEYNQYGQQLHEYSAEMYRQQSDSEVQENPGRSRTPSPPRLSPDLAAMSYAMPHAACMAAFAPGDWGVDPTVAPTFADLGMQDINSGYEGTYEQNEGYGRRGRQSKKSWGKLREMPAAKFEKFPSSKDLKFSSYAEDWEVGSQATSDWETCSTTSSRVARRSGMSYIATNLAYLDSKDSACVIAVKRITKLGFGAAGALRRHFEQWGPVEDVLLSNVPQNGEPSQLPPGMRKRPPGMGWVVMQNADDAALALAAGECLTIQSAHIRATPFVRRFDIDNIDTVPEHTFTRSSSLAETTIDEESLEELEESQESQSSGKEDSEHVVDFTQPFRGRWCDA